MRKLGTFLLGCIAAAGGSAPALAADIPNLSAPAPVVIAPVPVDAGFDWNRFYAGLQTGVWYALAPIEFDSFRAAAVVGRTVEIGQRLVVGAEAVGGAYFYPGEVLFEAYGLGRAGIALGDRLLVYGAFGAGFDFDPGNGGPIMLVGGGTEIGIGQHLGLRGEVLALRYFGEPFSFVSATVGVNWYFGR